MALLLRFLIGGIVVRAFASLADVLKPKTFAGLFGAAPSVALASMALTVSQNGKAFAIDETRSMIAGAVAFFLYAVVCVQLMMVWKGNNAEEKARRLMLAVRPSEASDCSRLSAWYVFSFSAGLPRSCFASRQAAGFSFPSFFGI